MKWIKNIFREIYGLFVDDGVFALSILIWLGIMFWAIAHIGLSSSTTAIVLFAGLALILIESTTRYARRKHLATKR